MEKRSLSLQPWEALFGGDLPEVEGVHGERTAFDAARRGMIARLGRELARVAALPAAAAAPASATGEAHSAAAARAAETAPGEFIYRSILCEFC